MTLHIDTFPEGTTSELPNRRPNTILEELSHAINREIMANIAFKLSTDPEHMRGLKDGGIGQDEVSIPAEAVLEDMDTESAALAAEYLAAGGTQGSIDKLAERATAEATNIAELINSAFQRSK